MIHYNMSGQVSLAYLRDMFRLAYEGQPLAEVRARIVARLLRCWYVAELKQRAMARSARPTRASLHVSRAGCAPA